ncbi:MULTISPECIES: DUF7147 family protein [Salimicrobium]|uniref:Methylthioribose kinase n=3 Tax=Salimicrobium TaxID=351195 RepID=K2FLG8_9BACI|nr:MULTISPECIES: hypothetical protein [Salimicrobium]AKG04667.1 methylthioribose kinase [Salimicrobium jeotgali]EKE31836.1 hypothetical protein MJ3_06843 [Salimicrobium jeotgali]MBM7696201.1 hypothetical protein [Salimicrobium jeotgali]SDX34322.1 hypothetical protein SAMN04488081_0227 [Salimicrobium album]SIS61262.1 hypothetical protein SAMN05421758_10324 [Salimicrobium salexigens]
MRQKFIELGEGYTDIYELVELGKRMPARVEAALAFHSEIDGKPKTSLALIMKPAEKFQPIYICREGIPNPHEIPNTRFDLFKEMTDEIGVEIQEYTLKPSTMFPETDLYYQYLIGILRSNKALARLT